MSVRSRFFARVARLGHPTRTSIRVERGLPVTMHDGIVLLTDRWFAADGRPDDPVILVRSPYGPVAGDLIAELFAERGFTVVVQNCRGSFGSGGKLEPLFGEEEDGAATLEWLDQQPWATGELLLFGASYLGLTAWAVKKRSNRAIGAMALGVTSTDFRRAAIYPSGRFGLSSALAWRYQMRNQEMSTLQLRLEQGRITRIIRQAAAAGPAADADIRAFGEPDETYRDWLGHAPDDPWWSRIDFDDELDAIPPTVLVAGWYDLFLDAQLDDYARLLATGQPVRLVVGPWTHGSAGLATTTLRESLAMFGSERDRRGARIWFGGSGVWKDLPSWPPESTDRVLGLGTDGVLGDLNRSSVGPARSFRTVAGDPAPAIGGRTLFPADAGKKSQSDRERREDVLTYSTPALETDLTIAGRPSVRLSVSVTVPASASASASASTSVHAPAVPDATASATRGWFVRLCDVSPAGRSWNVCDGAAVEAVAEASGPETRQVLDITLSPTAYRFRRGHRVRLQVSADAFPTYATEGLGDSERFVHFDEAGESTITLPVLTGA